MKVTKALDLAGLATELATAGVPVPLGLSTDGRAADGSTNLFTFNSNGAPVELPAGAAAVVNAHDATRTPGALQAAADLGNIQDLANTYQAMLTAIGGIHAHMTAINNGPATPTNAQIGSALKTLASDLDTVVTGCQKLLNVVAVLVKQQINH